MSATSTAPSTEPLRTKNDLINLVSAETGMGLRDSRRAVESVIGALASLPDQDSPLSLRGLGTFKPTTRKPRTSCLRTGTYEIPAYRTLAFKPSRTLRR